MTPEEIMANCDHDYVCLIGGLRCSKPECKHFIAGRHLNTPLGEASSRQLKEMKELDDILCHELQVKHDIFIGEMKFKAKYFFIGMALSVLLGLSIAAEFWIWKNVY